MDELIARIEAAVDPDRLLDCDIRLAVFGDCQYGVLTDHKHRAVGPAFLSGYVETFRDVINADDAIEDSVVPRFTASTEAAMSLVPEEWAWTLYSDGSCEIGYEPERGGLMNPEHLAECATPALALCAAALRARAA